MGLRYFTLVLILFSFLLTGCYKQSDADFESSDQALVQQLVTRFVDDLNSSGERNMQVYSVPFWADGHWVTSMEQLVAEIPQDNTAEFPGLKSMHLRMYPVAHLDVLFASAWERLQNSDLPDKGLEGVYAAAITLEIEGTGKTEQGWLLLRKVEGLWKVAGVIEH